jgi:hypothetical protein
MQLDARMLCVSDEPDPQQGASFQMPNAPAKPEPTYSGSEAVKLHKNYTDALDARGIKYRIEKGTVIIESMPPREQLILSFFSPNTPCPFPGCEELRRKYFEEVEALGPDCVDCQEGGVMRKYLEIIRPLVPHELATTRPEQTPGPGAPDGSGTGNVQSPQPG